MNDTIRFPGAPDVNPLTLAYLHASVSSGFTSGLLHTRRVPYAILCQALGGSYRITTPSQTVAIEPGELYLMPTNVPFTNVHLPPAGATMGARWVHFVFMLHGVLDFTSFLDLPIRVGGDLGKAAGETIGRLVELAEAKPSLASLSQTNELAFRLLSTVCSLAGDSSLAENGAWRARRILPALQLIQRKYATKLDVQTLARESAMSASRFYAHFKEVMKCSPFEYVTRWRMKEAQRRLMATDDCIHEVGRAVGYDNPFHFSRTFHQQVGTSPSTFRDNHRDMR